jgi:hypothetical protein
MFFTTETGKGIKGKSVLLVCPVAKKLAEISKKRSLVFKG